MKNKNLDYWVKRISQLFSVMCLSGFVYTSMEVIYRGRTDLSMYVLAAIVGLEIFLLNNTIYTFDTDFLVQVLTGALLATAGEFLFGITLNKDYHIWDYRKLPGNIMGQTCPQFTLIWIVVCAFALVFLDWVDWHWFHNDPKPYYRFKLINKNKKYYFY